jgi:PTH1 family peptidyl-tRNA hydrolase
LKVIAGLGNPGEAYRASRHNAGSLVVARLAAEHGIRLGAGRGDFMGGVGSIGGARALLVVPLTYMNRSGDALADALAGCGGAPEDLLVVCDDVDLPLGQLRFRRSGGDGGHKGLRSIIERLSSDAFARLRLGVGRPPSDVETSDYVLDRFLPEEEEPAREMTARAVDAVVLMLREGLEAAMNEYNRRPTPKADPTARRSDE